MDPVLLAACDLSVTSECYETLQRMLAEIQGLGDTPKLFDLDGEPQEEITIAPPVRARWGSLKDASIVARLSHIEERPAGDSRAVYVVS